MEFYWDYVDGLTEKKWEEMQEWTQGELEYSDFLGNTRVGDLCVEFLNRDGYINFEVYVGGVDDGYGYALYDPTNPEQLYPYTYYDGGCLGEMDGLLGYDYDEFVRIAEINIRKFIQDCGAVSWDGETLLKKAEEPLHVW